MAKRKKRKNSHRGRNSQRRSKPKTVILTAKTKRRIFSLVLGLIGVAIIFSFFQKAGIAGLYLAKFLNLIFGHLYFLLPLIFLFASFIVFSAEIEHSLKGVLLGFFLILIGMAGLLSNLSENKDLMVERGGWIGYFLALSFSKFFGRPLSSVIFAGFLLAGFIILRQFFKQESFLTEREESGEAEKEKLGRKEDFKIEKVFLKERLPNLKINHLDSKKEKEKKETLSPSDSFQRKIFEQQKEIGFRLPPPDLLENDREKPTSGDIRVNSAIIKRTLENFGIPVEMAEVYVGPTVTQYTLKPAEGIRLSKITALSNDLSLALAAHPIRIEAPIPGKSLVGIEVPNPRRALIRLRPLIENQEFQNNPSLLKIVLGRNVAGKPVYADLSIMPHLLVAGATGTGKTMFLNVLLISLLYRNSPETLRLILVDPKRVEFSVYEGIPHLLSPIIYDPQKTINALNWLIKEMERRFSILSAERARDLGVYNSMMIKKKKPIMPYIVLVIDELADLMSARGRDLEAAIVRLAQMARAVGIHLVLATQRPSVEVITGLIKANITSRIAFQVASQVDSRTILDMAGAEKLLGRGDMLFLSPEATKPKRIQGVYLSEKEIKKVISFVKEEYKKLLAEEERGMKEDLLEKGLKEELERKEKESVLFEEEDPLFEEAKRVVIEAGKASASLLQRRLRVGYARAARLIDMLEERGIVGPADGAKPRDVLIGREEEKGGLFKKI